MTVVNLSPFPNPPYRPSSLEKLDTKLSPTKGDESPPRAPLSCPTSNCSAQSRAKA